MESSALTAKHKAEALKKQLLDCLQQENQQFLNIAQAFFDKDTLSETDKTALLKAIIEAVDHVLTAGDWDSSLFLRNIVKPLKNIKAEAEAELQTHSGAGTAADIAVAPLSSSEVEVYISLFQSDGYNMNKWEMQLRSLERYIVGRPVYQHQADVEKRIRLKAGTVNEAYIAVAILKSEILTDTVSTLQKDPHGHPLLSLKETALKTGRIISFTHQNIHYRFVSGKLIRMT